MSVYDTSVLTSDFVTRWAGEGLGESLAAIAVNTVNQTIKRYGREDFDFQLATSSSKFQCERRISVLNDNTSEEIIRT